MDIQQIKKDLDNKVMLGPVTIKAVVERLYELEMARVAEPDWENMRKLSNVSEVHETLAVFAEDPTEDNGIGILQAIVKIVRTVEQDIPFVNFSELGG